MKLNSIFALVLLLASFIARADDNEALAVAEDVALSWLSLTDRGRYEESWTGAASLFQAAVSKADWVQSLTAVRAPLGDLNSRNVASATFAHTLPGAPDGEYVVFQLNASFDNKVSAVETVTAMKDEDGIWRIAGYYIK